MQSSRRYIPHLLAWLAPLALLFLVAIAYQDAPENTFHFDDQRNITLHPPVFIKNLSVEEVVTAARNAKISTRPLPSATFAIDWWRGGGSARPFQYSNVAIHAAAAVAVFGLLLLVLRRLRQSKEVSIVAAFLGAALWATHPIQVQAVTYIVQRMTSMTALFTVLTVLLYILGRQAGQPGRRWLFFALAALCWFLGLASKETAAIGPFLILLAEYGVLRHRQSLIRSRIDWAVLALPIIVAVLIVVDITSGAGPLSEAFLPGYEKREFTLAERLLTQPRVIAFHFSQILWPLPGRFSLEHDLAFSSGLLTPASTLIALLAVLAWCALGVWALFRQSLRVLGFFMLWVPATLAIESTFIPLEMVFEHRMYLPSVALAGLGSLGLALLFERVRRFRPALLAAAVLVLGLLMLSTAQRVPDWRSSISLAEATVETAPQSARAWSTLANAYWESGAGWNKIQPPMMKALSLNPDQLVALHLSAIRLIEMRRLDEAELILRRIEPKAQKDYSILNTIGMLHFERGNFAAAVQQYQKAITLNGFVPEFRYNLALAYELSGQCAQAHSAWLTFLQIETSEQRAALVRGRLQRNFEAEGGRCHGRYR